MADLRDEHGNPVQLTDQFGKPVQLTDEYGNPIHIKGVATTEQKHGQEQIHRSSSSSSSSSEDDGQGGRRKKKGLKGKVKDALGGGDKSKEEEMTPEAAAKAESKTGLEVGLDEERKVDHEKRGILEKIKEKLPGHHHQH